MEPVQKKRKMKVKLFNKMYRDMQESIKIVLKRNNDQSFSVNKNKDIELFSEEMDRYIDLYNNTDSELLKKVTLLEKFFKNKPSLTDTNKTVVWKYIEVLYSISKEEKKESLNKKENFNMTSISEVVGTLLNDEPSGFKDLIKDISGKLESNIGDKELDQSQILKDLMSGNMQSCGINFQEIISESSKNLHDRVESGQIDIEKLKNIASKLKSGMNL